MPDTLPLPNTPVGCKRQHNADNPWRSGPARRTLRAPAAQERNTSLACGGDDGEMSVRWWLTGTRFFTCRVLWRGWG